MLFRQNAVIIYSIFAPSRRFCAKWRAAPRVRELAHSIRNGPWWLKIAFRKLRDADVNCG